MAESNEQTAGYQAQTLAFNDAVVDDLLCSENNLINISCFACDE